MKRYKNNWNKKNVQVFWGEVAPGHHLLQLYENEKALLDTLEAFAGCGFQARESVVIIATDSHLQELENRLQTKGFDLKILATKGLFLPIKADEALARFMVKDWPDEQRFRSYVTQIIGKAKKGGRQVRAFGEMVAVLWGRGLSGATVRLEHLWDHLVREEKLSLFCAYPKSGFTQDLRLSLQCICDNHSMVIAGDKMPSTEVYYQGTYKSGSGW